MTTNEPIAITADVAQAAIILSGGRSSRMGRPKAWLPLDGTPLLVWVARRVTPLVREIVIVGAADQDLPDVAAAVDVDVTVVRDREPDIGPLPALGLGLETLRADAAFALACDAPFVSPDLLALLTTELGDADAVIPTWDDRLQPLTALYRRRLAPAVGALVAAGERRAHAIASLPGCRVLSADRVRAADPSGASFRAVNTPEEYAAVVASLSGR